MHSTQRSSLRGTVGNILIIVLILTSIFTSIYFINRNVRITEANDILSSTMENQAIIIQDLQFQNLDLNDYATRLEEENKKLQTQMKEVLNSKDIGGLFKSYTDYKCLSRNSLQWQIQERAYTDENGLRKVDDAYLVALGSYYGTTLGTQYVVTLSNGNTFKVMLCDCKKDIHTDSKNQKCEINNSILEFYVDASKLPKSVKTSGSISTIDFFDGEVISIIQIQ